MLECFFDGHDHNRRWLFAVNGKPSLELRILTNACAPVHTIGFIHPRHKENHSNTRVLNKVL
jgi:hypothetical protein